MSPFVMHYGAVTLTPTTVTNQIAASGDDCYARESSTFTSTSTNNWVGHYNSTSYNYRSMMRFQLNVPQGVTIDSAYMEQHSDGDLTGGTWPLETEIAAEDTDNATQIADYTDFTNREATLTTAKVNWDVPSGWGSSDVWHQSPDIKSVIQEIVNRPGWVSGNWVNIWWGPRDPNYTAAQDLIVQGESYDGTPSEAAKLEVTYLS